MVCAVADTFTGTPDFRHGPGKITAANESKGMPMVKTVNQATPLHDINTQHTFQSNVYTRTQQIVISCNNGLQQTVQQEKVTANWNASYISQVRGPHRCILD